MRSEKWSRAADTGPAVRNYSKLFGVGGGASSCQLEPAREASGNTTWQITLVYLSPGLKLENAASGSVLSPFWDRVGGSGEGLIGPFWHVGAS